MYPSRDKIKKMQRSQWFNIAGIIICTAQAIYNFFQDMWPISLLQLTLTAVCVWSYRLNKRSIAIHKEVDRKYIQYICDNFSGCLSFGELEMMRVLEMWVISERPSDYPTKFVARKFEVTSVPKPTSETKIADTLEGVRQMLPPGLFCLARDPSDEPQIVETWL